MKTRELMTRSLAGGEAQARAALAARRKDRTRGVEWGSAGVLIAEGDSWFDYPRRDIIDVLEDLHGYDVNKVAQAGDTVEEMAYQPGQLEDFIRAVEKVIARGRVPRAILLSAGGNDIAGDRFEELLNHSAAPNRGLNLEMVHEFLDVRIKAAYVHILSAITTVCEDQLGHPVPVLTHSYDYAVADGRGCLGKGPWLEPGFRAKAYFDMAERREILVTLIDRFHDMMVSVGKVRGLGHVHHVDLRTQLPNDPKTFKRWWENELHPTQKGFKAVGEAFARTLAAL
jgi:lysophospholipase L1-like esterase